MRIALLLLAAAGCKSSREPPAPPPPPAPADADSGIVVQPGVAEHSLAFAIDVVHANQQPSDAPPYHGAGGTWTYIEAHIAGDPAATFVVGIPVIAHAKDEPGFGSMYLVPTTAAAGTRVIDAFARQFEVAVPPRVPGGQLAPMKISVALLGHGLGRDIGFSGTGTWDANKWFLGYEDIDGAEVFFNVSVPTKQGEFAEKDVEYSKDVATCLAAALRDGVPPPRTPANDPTLSAIGPQIVIGKQLDDRRMEEIALAPDRLLMHRDRPTGSTLFEVDPTTGAMKELYKTPDRIEVGNCDATFTRCVIRETRPSGRRNVHSGEDPAKLLLLEGRTVTPLVVPAFGSKPQAAERPVSPDGRWIVASLAPYTSNRLVAWNRTTKQVITADTDVALDVIEWHKDGAAWSAILSDRSYEAKPEYRDWHLDGDGKVVPSSHTIPDGFSPISPNGKRRADFTKDGKLVITPLPAGTPRTLVLHRADAKYAQPGCCRWLDNRYLELPAARSGVIDTDTLKVSFLPPLPDESARVAYGPDGRYALVVGDKGTFLATLVPPK